MKKVKVVGVECQIPNRLESVVLEIIAPLKYDLTVDTRRAVGAKLKAIGLEDVAETLGSKTS